MTMSFVSALPYLISVAALFILLEQLWYLKKKRFVPGPSVVIPLVGNGVSLVRNPSRFWDGQRSLSLSTGFSSNYIMGRFIIFIRSTELSHKVFSNVRPDAFHLVGHPFGRKLFGEHNLIYMFGEQHKHLRRQIAPNFTPRALSTYTHLQFTIIRTHLQSWLHLSASSPLPLSLRFLVRHMNLETSQSVFVGPYLDRHSKLCFQSDYNLFNVGLMALPLDLPGFAFRKARFAVSRLVDTLAACAQRSKERMEMGGEPACLVDYWMQNNIDSSPPPREVGGHLFDFLFAAQDASTSSLLWAVTLLESHPQVLARVREEVASVWSPDSGRPITAEELAEMRYTAAVAREVVRYRAPATMVPHVAGEEFALTETYTIPKGTIVFPSVYESSFQGFREAERFDPDRFSEERQEDREFKRNFLAFGAGPHQCVGQRYALNHLLLFIALFTATVDFKRHRTDGCDDIMYVPTICPKDDCKVFLNHRFPASTLQ